MRKVILIFSFIFILVGILIQVLSNSLEELMPRIGYVAFQSAAAGSYSPESYKLDLSSNYGWSRFCIFAGILGTLVLIFETQIRYFIKMIRNKNNS